MRISVVIPVLNEAQVLPGCLAGCSQAWERVVVDGGSTDRSLEAARAAGARLVSAPRGRGAQLAAGARACSGDVFLFLHADTRLPKDWDVHVRRALSRSGARWGCFLLGIVPPRPALSAISWGANLRTLLFRLPYGDQAVFVRQDAYFGAGGFADAPLMEDVDLARRLGAGGGFSPVRAKVEASARRWEAEGPFVATLRNYRLLTRYLLGASPESLAGHYPDVR
ncbi:MAG: TIGR04283 family arsenosugar biosynthesis glycosyltransferase [Proteobacteria bacterium]|nr:TIGR04283 family arsenosugar biosynthesis glycosyltransferase [Pseudomonadota bacterium]